MFPSHQPSRRTFLGGLSVAGLSVFSSSLAKAADDVVIGHGTHRYRVDLDWGVRRIDSTKHPVMNCHEMVQDSKGRLIMLGDHTANNVLIYDKSGQLLDFWGTEYPGGHGLTLGRDDKGEEFLLIVDCGWYWKNEKWNRQQGRVIKTDLTGKVLLDIGHPATYRAYEPEMTYMPTETAVAPNGDIYIADGYGSNYILRFDKHGRFISKFGGAKPEGDPQGALSNAHGIAVDLRDANNPVLIATSRAENCFKRFTLEGKFIDRIDVPGCFVCRAVIAGDHLHAGVCWSKENGTGKRLNDSGFVVILDKNNKVISAPGGTEPVYDGGVLKPLAQAPDKTFHHGHDVCPDDDGNLYVCQWNAGKTYPVKLVKA